MTTWDGMVYEGVFSNGKMVGRFTISLPGKYVFEGEIQVHEGDKEGKGTQMELNLNLRYEGEFKGGLYHGQGRLISTTDGKVYYSGRFTNGQIDSSPMAIETAPEDSNDKL